jgi:peptidoglycan/LPS O-acetylase OafA/YrhL
VTDSPPAKAKGALHIPSLDGIRAASFLIVFLSHAGLKGKVPGYVGLSVFFFLSGYLITTLLRREFDRYQDISLKQFYLRRVLRIFPPFYLVLFAAYAICALGLWESSPLTPGAVAAQLAHGTNYYIVQHGWWTGLAPGTWVYWSLAVEEHFYLVFPLLYIWLRRRGYTARQQAAILLGICGVILAWRCVLVFGLHAPKDRTYVASDTRVDSILAGCLLAVWKNPVLDEDGPSDRDLLSKWVPLGTLMFIVSLVYRKPEFEQTFRYTLQSFGLLPLFIAAIRFHDKPIISLLGTAPAKYLGLLSYSMYLTHTSVIYGFESWTRWPEPIRAVAALATVVLLGTFFYYVIEKPIGQLRRRHSRA